MWSQFPSLPNRRQSKEPRPKEPRPPSRSRLLLMWLAFSLGLGLCLQSTAAGAQSASGAWILLHAGDFDWQSRLDRLRVARDLQRRVDALRQKIPPQSPAELEQVDQRDAAFTEAMSQQRSRLFLSAAYQHRELVRNLDRIYAALACVRGEPLSVSQEMACWADAAAALLREEQMRLALNTLRKARRLPRKRDTAVIDRDPDLWYAHFGRGILTYLLQPYLTASASPPEAPTERVEPVSQPASQPISQPDRE